MEPEEYIRNRVDNQIQYFGIAAAKNKKWFYVISILKIVLSLVLCIGSAIYGKGSGESIIVSVVSGVLALLESLMILFKSNEKWIIYREASEKLKKEKNLFLTMTGSYYSMSKEDAFNTFTQKIEFILDETNSQWKGIESKKGEKVNA